MVEEKVTISVSGIIEDLENGVTRIGLAKKYNISPREVKSMFENPKLKGRKVKKTFVPSFELIDDTDDEGNKIEENANVEETNQEIPKTEPNFE